MFDDRVQAAEMLAAQLEKYRGHPLVLGIPRGGVIMAAVVARRLGGDLDVVLVHKLGEPRNPEVAIGAIDEEGHIMLQEQAHRWGISEDYVESEAKAQFEQLRARRARYTPVRSCLEPRGRCVIVIDDGLATGATMLCALSSLRGRGAAKLVAATAVAPRETLDAVGRMADDVVCLESPFAFMAVGQFFRDFSQVSDEEVIDVLSNWTRQGRPEQTGQ